MDLILVLLLDGRHDIRAQQCGGANALSAVADSADSSCLDR